MILPFLVNEVNIKERPFLHMVCNMSFVVVSAITSRALSWFYVDFLNLPGEELRKAAGFYRRTASTLARNKGIEKRDLGKLFLKSVYRQIKKKGNANVRKRMTNV